MKSDNTIEIHELEEVESFELLSEAWQIDSPDTQPRSFPLLVSARQKKLSDVIAYPIFRMPFSSISVFPRATFAPKMSWLAWLRANDRRNESPVLRRQWNEALRK